MQRTAKELVSLGHAIRAAREAQGITQQKLAELTHFPAAQTVSDIERGIREVKAWELVRIAEALNTPVDVLLGLRHEDQVKVFWRRGSKAATPGREAQLLRRSRRYAQLEELCELPPPRQLPEFSLNSAKLTPADTLRLADDLRSTLDLGSRPAASIGKVLEEGFGIKIFYEDLEGDESAACAKGDFGAAILMDVTESPWRCNFNFAHELFHLVTWEAVTKALPKSEEAQQEWLETIEKLANRFASHLLLPADELLAQYDARKELRELDHADLVELAREFDVSTAALLWRLVNLGRLQAARVRELLDDQDFQRQDRRSMWSKWPTSRPDSLPHRFKRLAILAYEKGKIGRARLAEYLEVRIGELGFLDVENDSASSPETAFA